MATPPYSVFLWFSIKFHMVDHNSEHASANACFSVRRGPAGEDWRISSRAWRTHPGSWPFLCTSQTVTRRASSSADRCGHLFPQTDRLVASQLLCHLVAVASSPFPQLSVCSVSRRVVGGGGSVGAWTGSAWKSPASTMPEETCSAKTTRAAAAATATNESELVVLAEPFF